MTLGLESFLSVFSDPYYLDYLDYLDCLDCLDETVQILIL